MIAAIGGFVAELRKEGVRISPAEILDASRAIDAVGLTERGRFKTALGATLAKTAKQREVFDRVFDRFFVAPPGAPRGKSKERGGALAKDATKRKRADAEGHGKRLLPPDVPRADRLRKLVEDVRNARRLGRLRIVRLQTDRAERATRREEPSSVGRAERRELARSMSSAEEEELARMMPKLVQEIRLRSGRRHRASRQGRLHVRRLLRENLAHGGIPFVLPFRRRRPRTPRVVLLVDVSFSVARSAGFFLALASEFLRIGRSTRVVAFVDRPVDATSAVRKWVGRTRGATAPASVPPPRRRGRRAGEGIRLRGVSFADVLDSLHGLNLDAPSDYGRALHALAGSELRPSGSDTVLVILGDARTNRFDPLPWALEEISRRCRHVLWLVSEPRGRWGTGDSALASYLPWVDVAVEAHDLAGLARGLAELVRKL